MNKAPEGLGLALRLEDADVRIARLENALRELVRTAPLVAYTDCPFGHDCMEFDNAMNQAEELIKESIA